jgi:hypothetical protein
MKFKNILRFTFIISVYFLFVFTFVNMVVYDEVCYSEPNKVILWSEVLITAIFGVITFDYSKKELREVKK